MARNEGILKKIKEDIEGPKFREEGSGHVRRQL